MTLKQTISDQIGAYNGGATALDNDGYAIGGFETVGDAIDSVSKKGGTILLVDGRRFPVAPWEDRMEHALREKAETVAPGIGDRIQFSFVRLP